MSDTEQKNRNKKMGTAVSAKSAQASKSTKITATTKSSKSRSTGNNVDARSTSKTTDKTKVSGKTASPKPPRATKAAAVLALLRTKQGVSIEEMVEATGWQTHSVRGFLSGTVKKKLDLVVESEKDKAGVRKYRIATEEGAGSGANAGSKRGSGKTDVNHLTPLS